MSYGDTTPDREYPAAVRARLDEPLSRWLWLVKWILAIPHYVVLFFLWIAFSLVTVVAFVAILVTGRYPRALFNFNLGVIRWTWRVLYYSYGALGTDRYPPFTLAAVPEYPAMVDIAYPEQLSRGLVLVKWWLLAIPHYLILNLFTSGLVQLCVLFAAVALLFTTRYPPGLYDLVVGINRWVLRVLAYTALMTDAYPPFRLDQGGEEPAVTGRPAPSGPYTAGAPSPAAMSATGSSTGPVGGPTGGTGARRGAAVPVVALVVGLLLFLPGVVMTALGGGGLWLDAQRDREGYVTAAKQRLATDTAAITVENVDLDIDRGTGMWAGNDLGRIRVWATSADDRPLFVGIAPQYLVDQWLNGVAHHQIQGFGDRDFGGRDFGDRDFGDDGTVRYLRQDGTAALSPPGEQTFWAASTSGSGTQKLTWSPETGRWALVIARPDGAPGVGATVDVGAKIPDLTGLATGLLITGLLLLALGAVLVVLGAIGLGRRTGGPDGTAGQPALATPPPSGPEETARARSPETPETPETPAGTPPEARSSSPRSS